MSTIVTSHKPVIERISYATAVKSMLLLPACIIVFHLLIVAGVLPYTIVWGGRLQNSAEMLKFESISIAINGLVMLVVAMQASYLKRRIPQQLMTIVLWGLFGLFVANTIANVFSVTLFERLVFTPLTFLFAVFTYRIIHFRQQPSDLSN